MRSSYLISGSALALALGVSPALAQPTGVSPADAPTTATSIDTSTEARASADVTADIVVTARKRGEERLQDIPASISAISGDALAKQGATNFTDFAYRVPGLTFTDQGPGQKRYTLRGVQSAGQEQVAVYYDEVPIPGIQSSTGDSGSQIGDLQLYDLDRVEVLKGPQSTTFGANSQTGAVRYILKKPQLTDFGGSAQVELNNVAHGGTGANALGMVNLPLVNGKLGLRVVGYYVLTPGYVDNVRLGLKDVNEDRNRGVRAMLRWEANDWLTFDAMAWYQKRFTKGASETQPYDTFRERGDPSDQGYKDVVPSFARFQTGPYNAGFYVRTPRPDEQQIYSLTGTADLGFGVLTATGSIYKRDFQYYRENSFSIISLGGGPAGAICLRGVPCRRADLFPELTDQTQTLNQKTAEIRLNSSGTGPFQWLVGAFYRDRASDFRSYSPIVDAQGFPIVATTPPTGFSITPGAGIEGCNPCGFARVNTRSIKESALFGEATLDLTDWLEVMGGLRYFEAKQTDFGSTLFQSPLLGSTLPADYNRRVKENRLIKKAQISIKPSDDITFYVLASEGYRLGGTNQSASVLVPDGYDSDSLWNYEAGIKTTWFDRRLIVNASVYRIDWSNIQVTGRDPTGTFGFIGNAGDARFEGLELEVQARPTQRWSLSGGLNWLPKHELTEDQRSTTIVANGLAGDKIPRVPTLTANFSGQYTVPLNDSWSAYVRGDYSFKGKAGTELRPTLSTYRIQRSFSLVNVRVGADDEDSKLGIALFVNNLFDKRADVYVVAATAQPTYRILAQPRTIGITATKQF